MESTTTLPDDLNSQSSRRMTDTGSRLDMLEQKVCIWMNACLYVMDVNDVLGVAVESVG
jgi:hypothetical protein